MLTVTALAIYPIKACRGMSLTQMSFDDLGPRWDRRWMVVDGSGLFVTQRKHKALGAVSVTVDEATLSVTALGMPPLCLPIRHELADVRPVKVWRYQGRADDCGDEAAEWFTQVVGAPVRLVRAREDDERWVDPKYCPEPLRVGFADGYPVLLTTEGSRRHLEELAGMPLPMSRFRPNVVVEGAAPFAEDDWTRVGIGARILDVRKPCERCVVINIDPETLETSPRPLRALAELGKAGRGATFGQNCTASGTGVIRLGDEVRILR